MFNKNIITRKELTRLADSLEKNNVPFTYSINNHTFRISCPMGEYLATDSLIPIYELWLVAWVKNYVLRHKIYKLKDICGDWENIKYLRVKKRRQKVYNTVYEVDLNRAYWETAFELGIISDEIYWRGLWIDKKTRLAAIGQMAKRTDIWKFNGHKWRCCKPFISKKTQHLWFNVCYKVGLTMERAARLCAKSTLFYWVDGIYVTNKSSAKKIMRFFNSRGYDSKIKKMKRLEATPTMIKVYDKKMRKFYVSSEKFGLMK